MPLPILQPSTNLETQIRGEVIIDDSAIIADGAILNASQGCKIIIRAGACLGMGTIINAYRGNVEIKESVILGSGSLIVGCCVVGSQASLGASVTVYNANVEPRTVIPAGTVIGDRSRQPDLSKVEKNNTAEENNLDNKHQDNGKAISEPNHVEQLHQFVNPYSQYKISSPPINNQKKEAEKLEVETEQQEQIQPPINNNKNPQNSNTNQTVETENHSIAEEKVVEKTNQNDSKGKENTQQNNEQVADADPWDNENLPGKSNSVVGKVYINKLLYTLFPHKN